MVKIGLKEELDEFFDWYTKNKETKSITESFGN